MINKLINKCEENLKKQFEYFEDVALFNQEKVLDAFKNNRLALRHFTGTTGYGYGDEGRDVLNKVFSDIFKAEAAICSPSIVSGTHALSLSLFGVLMPGDRALCITGTPYDTLNDVIYGDGIGSLKDFGVKFDCLSLKNDLIDKDKIKEYFINYGAPDMIYMQRSRGYEWRNAMSIDEIHDAVNYVKRFKNVDFERCIAEMMEFIEKQEATEVGVNLMAGSMIKNPGGGIAPTGGYVVGDKFYVDKVQSRLTAPSIGGEVGSYAFGYQYFFQGLFLAPHTVLQAMKGSLLFGSVLSELGYETSPKAGDLPRDIIRAIKFGNEKDLISFIQTIQYNSPIDSFVDALPWEMPGYENEVIMAAGCFVQGSSIELSADAPIKPPYIAYMQGGLTYEHCKIALKNIVEKLK